MVKDIADVSEHQIKINFNKAKDQVDGFIIRSGYGDDLPEQDDKYAVYNFSECERLGIPYASYLYSYAGNDKQIQSEIEHEKRVTAGYNPVYHILDLEEWGLRGVGLKAAKAWLKAFPDNGIIYAGQAWWKSPLLGLNCRRWIPAYGKNSGKPEKVYKPDYTMEGWQYTSRGRLPGITGNVDLSEWYGTFGSAEGGREKPASGVRVVYKKEVACLLFVHLCTHNAHGYTMDMGGRQGTGEEVVDILGHEYTIKGGDRDCSSALISAFEAAGISCGGATYTGNMKRCMVASGNFEVKPMSYTAQMSDVYLNEKNHTAMCISAEPDILGEFSINEKGTGYGGKVGDQKQSGEYDETLGRGESHLANYYDRPWDMILRCKNNEVAFVIEEDDTAAQKPVEATEPAQAEKPAETAEKPVQSRTSRDTAILAARVFLNDYGTGGLRKRWLGDKYSEVQECVDVVSADHREELIDAMAEFIMSL